MATDAKNNIGSSPLTLDWGAISTDSLTSAIDVDYWKLPQVDKASKVTLDFTGLSSTASNSEFKISIVDGSDGAVVTTTKGLSTSISGAIAADKNYYVKVEKGTTSSSEKFSVKASFTPTVESEANGTIAEADILVPNAAFTGYLGSSSSADGSDVDYYVFTTGPDNGSTVAITGAATATTGGTFYKLSVVNENNVTYKDASQQNLTKTVAGGTNGTLNFTVTSSGNTKKGTYYLKVEAASPGTFKDSSEAKNPYTITLAGNTDYNEAPSVSMGGVTSGAFGSANVVSSQTKTVGLGTTTSNQISLKDFITATDPDKSGTVNSAIKSYYIGLKDTSIGDPDLVSVAKNYSGSGAMTLASGSSVTNGIANSNLGSAITSCIDP